MNQKKVVIIALSIGAVVVIAIAAIGGFLVFNQVRQKQVAENFFAQNPAIAATPTQSAEESPEPTSTDTTLPNAPAPAFTLFNLDSLNAMDPNASITEYLDAVIKNLETTEAPAAIRGDVDELIVAFKELRGIMVKYEEVGDYFEALNAGYTDLGLTGDEAPSNDEMIAWMESMLNTARSITPPAKLAEYHQLYVSDLEAMVNYYRTSIASIPELPELPENPTEEEMNAYLEQMQNYNFEDYQLVPLPESKLATYDYESIFGTDTTRIEELGRKIDQLITKIYSYGSTNGYIQ